MAAERSVCGCVEPDERPDMTCGVCGLRRLGDDLSAEQFGGLVGALAPVFVAGDGAEPLQLVRRKRGRMVRRNERRV